MAGAAVTRRRALAATVIAAAVWIPAFWLVAVAAVLVAGSIPGSIADRRTFTAAGGAVV